MTDERDYCEGWKQLRPTQEDIDVISDGFAEDTLGHNLNGQENGCW